MSLLTRLDEIQQKIEIGNEREAEDPGSGDAVMSAWSMFAEVAQHHTPDLIAALRGTINLHQITMYDKWSRPTTDRAAAVSSWCKVCGNTREVECLTMRVITESLGSSR